jgi:DNA-binding transcriptional regulator YiaG
LIPTKQLNKQTKEGIKMKLTKKNVKKVLAEVIETKGTNYKELAQVLGVGTSTLYGWARGKRAPKAAAWADLLSVLAGEYTEAVQARIVSLLEGGVAGVGAVSVTGAPVEAGIQSSSDGDLAAIANILYSYRQLSTMGRQSVAPLFV